MRWDDYPVPWESEEIDDSSMSSSSPTLDVDTLELRLRLFNLEPPTTRDPRWQGFLSAVVRSKIEDEQRTDALRTDLKNRDLEIKEFRSRERKIRSEVSGEAAKLKEELARLEKAKNDLEAKYEKLRHHCLSLEQTIHDAKNRESKLNARIGAAERLTAHFQKLVRRERHRPPMIIGDEFEELVESEENPVSEITVPRDVESKIHNKDEEDDELTELEIYRGLIAGG